MKKLLVTAAAGLMAFAIHAAPIVDSGTGINVAQANAAWASWQTRVSSFSVDNLNGLTGTAVTQTSSAGNSFTRTSSATSLGNTDFTFGVLQGTTLFASRNSANAPASFTWTLAPASNAFGFFTWDNDGGQVGVTLVDGTTLNYNLNTAAGGSENSFWGISGLSSMVASVTLTTTDPGGVSYWDRFVTGTTRAQVPEPGSLALAGLALLGLIAARRRAVV